MDKDEMDLILNLMFIEACEIRGNFIHKFADIEFLLDAVIKQFAFENEEDFFNYIDETVKGLWEMNHKRELFLKNLERYELMYNESFDDLIVKLDLLIDKRNKLAHWAMDTSEEGISTYLNKNWLPFVIYDKHNKIKKDHITADSLEKITGKFKYVHHSLLRMKLRIDGIEPSDEDKEILGL